VCGAARPAPRRLAGQPDRAWFDIALMENGIRLAREAAGELAISLPSAAVAEDLLTRASELDYAHCELAALHKVLAQSPAA
jgi:hypothetical protein